jgi:hypothetical protein
MSAWLSTLAKPSITNEPPTEGELSRIDIAMIVTLLFALFLGLGVRNNVVNASRTVALGEGLPSVKVPTNWITGQPEGSLLYASNPRSPSIFNAELNVTTRPLPVGQDIVSVRTGLGLQRSQDLLRYRELDAQAVTVNGAQGVLVTYAYVADPTREQGAVAPPVVVQAQDLIFPNGNNAMIVTIATDATTWDEEEKAVQLIQDSLNMEILETEVVSEFQEGEQ